MHHGFVYNSLDFFSGLDFTSQGRLIILKLFFLREDFWYVLPNSSWLEMLEIKVSVNNIAATQISSCFKSLLLSCLSCIGLIKPARLAVYTTLFLSFLFVAFDSAFAVLVFILSYSELSNFMLYMSRQNGLFHLVFSQIFNLLFSTPLTFSQCA